MDETTSSEFTVSASSDGSGGINITIGGELSATSEPDAVTSSEPDAVTSSELITGVLTEDTSSHFTAMIEEQKTTNMLLSFVIGAILASVIIMLIARFSRGWR